MIEDRDASGKRGEHAAQRHHLNSPRRCRWRRAGVPVRLRGDVFEICGTMRAVPDRVTRRIRL